MSANAANCDTERATAARAGAGWGTGSTRSPASGGSHLRARPPSRPPVLLAHVHHGVALTEAPSSFFEEPAVP